METAVEEPVDRLSDEEEEEEDDLSTFIVDEEGRPTNASAKRRKTSTSRMSSSQMKTVEDIFGVSGEDFLGEHDYRRGENRTGEEDKSKFSITDLFEPEELKKQYFTPEDEEIRKTDIPEREQLKFGKRSYPAENEIKEEAEWIFNSAFKSIEEFNAQSVIPKIIYVLEFLRKEHLEISYIYTYKKDYYLPDLKLPDLWEIYDWDDKWAHLQNRKSTLKTLYSQAGVGEEYYKLLEESQTEIEVQDLFDNFQLYYGQDLETSNSTVQKRAIKRDLYRLCKKSNLLEFTQLFGLSAKQFGENLMSNYMSNEPTDPTQSPEIIAESYKCSEFQSSTSVLQAARGALSQEIAYDPLVRQSLRTIYEQRAIISTFPTTKGKKEVDAFHVYRAILRIEKKPAQAFKSIQFLEILKAEKEGFITFKIELPEDYQENELIKELEALYIVDGFSSLTEQWNEQRKLILRNALTTHLYPLLQKELKSKLTEEAMERVAVKCAEKLNQKIMAGPYKPPTDSYQDVPEDIRVMGAIWGGESFPTSFVVLDPEGELIAQLKLNHLNALESDPRKSQDLDKLKEFIKEYSPHVIAVGAQLEARRFYDEIHNIIQNSKELLLSQTVHVTYVDLEIPRIYSVSSRSTSEYPDYSIQIKQCISLARLLQDPLTEIAALCTLNDMEELLSLRLHSLQSMINKDYLFKVLERCLINTVNRVGVDINRLVSHKFASSTLQFLSGLGPRKASYLLTHVYRRGGRVTTREELDMFGPVVYANFIGFIRIVARHFNRNEDIDPLDDTRIHPSDYSLVRKMAADALGLRLSDEELVEKLVRRPEKLEDIDLDAFANELERNGQPRKKSILYDIKFEISHPFQDPRLAYRDPDPNELFTLLTNETDATFRIGQLVTVRVTGIAEKSVKCRLDNGIPGSIFIRDLSDSRVNAISDLAIDIGKSLTARIKSIDKEKLFVQLTSRGSDLRSDQWENSILEELTSLEPYLLLEKEETSSKPQLKKKSSKPKIITRRIDHPLFQNVTAQEAEKYLESKDKGEIVIRPSSRGLNYLTLTWKFYDNIYVHINIKEEGKLNAHSLGKVLSINDQKFESLDEIIALYMEPIINYSQELQQFRNFRHGDQEKIDQLLQDAKANNPKTIPYYINIAFDYPGKFILSYLPGSRVRHEPVSAIPNGYTFRQQKFSNPDKMIKWFKVHWKEPPPRPRSPPRSQDTTAFHLPRPEDMEEEPTRPMPADYSQNPWSSNAVPNNDSWGSSSDSWNNVTAASTTSYPTNPDPNWNQNNNWNSGNNYAPRGGRGGNRGGFRGSRGAGRGGNRGGGGNRNNFPTSSGGSWANNSWDTNTTTTTTTTTSDSWGANNSDSW